MTRRVLRWGRSAHETGSDLELERACAEALGLSWDLEPDPRREPPLVGVAVLVVTSAVRVDAGVLSRFGGDLVLTTTSGHDHVDLAAAAARGVTVARLPEARAEAVVHHALGAMIGLMRGMPALLDAASAGTWARGALPALAPVPLDRATVTVVGLGVIGTRMARVLTALGATVIGVDPAGVPDGVERRALREALPVSDAVTLHCALVPSTRGLFSAEVLALLPRHAVLINTARGAVVDVDRAVEAVREGALRGLLVDVFPEEPWPTLAAGAAVPGVWFTPHAAGYTRDLGVRVAEGVARALGAWVAGEPVPHRLQSPGRTP